MAPTPTSRLELLKPDPADLYDIGIHNGNMDILDRVGGLTFCTSSTRPASPFPGMEIYETDTALHYSWNDDLAVWVRITPGFSGGIRYDSANSTLTTLANNTTEQLSGMETGALILPANRSFRIKAKVEFDDVTGGVLTWRIRTDSLAGTAWGAQQGRPQVSSAIRQHETVEALIFTGGTDFSGKFVLTAQRGATNATVPRIYRSTTSRPFMYVEQMGGSSALAIV